MFALFLQSDDHLKQVIETALGEFKGKPIDELTRKEIICRIQTIARDSITIPVRVSVLHYERFNVFCLFNALPCDPELLLLYAEFGDQSDRGNVLEEMNKVWPKFSQRVWSYEL